MTIEPEDKTILELQSNGRLPASESSQNIVLDINPEHGRVEATLKRSGSDLGLYKEADNRPFSERLLDGSLDGGKTGMSIGGSDPSRDPRTPKKSIES